MENCFMFNGQTVPITEDQVKEIARILGVKKTKLADVKVGNTFKVGDYEFIVLEQSGDTTAVILKNLLYDNKQFGKNNNYAKSYIDDICNDFAAKVAKIIGKKNLVEHTVDLTSDDGLKDYGKITRSVSLLTTELYRRYVYILDQYKINKWWWLATSYSTPTHTDSSWVKCVTPSGGVGNFSCNGINGVRPFCIFDSSIFVS